MGDLSDQADLDRFLRSTEGQTYLQEIRQMLEGRRIQSLEFTTETHGIATTLCLDDDSTFAIFQPSLSLEAIREQFPEVLEREYYLDFPDRRPPSPPNI